MIFFHPAFKTTPAVVVQHIWDVGNADNFGGSTADQASVIGVSTDTAGVVTTKVAGRAEHRDFAFIAVGE